MTAKLELTNLYINPDYYNPDYNFYNYHRFKQTGIINIIYKTPSVFLNGLYLELPYSQIVQIKKLRGSSTFQLTLSITSNDIMDNSYAKVKIGTLLRKIDDYNSNFFKVNARKFEVRHCQTNKNTNYAFPTVRREPNSHRLENNAIVTGDASTQNRFRNPLIKKYAYASFINPDSTTTNTIITIDIKPMYIQKICELVKINKVLLDDSNKLIPVCTELNEFINQEYFDFKNAMYTKNLETDDIPFNIKLWIKANTLDTYGTNIYMTWKVCGYQL